MPRPSTGSSLTGVTVVVTRPRAQSATLIELLEQAGATVFAVPLTEVVDVAGIGEIEAALDVLGRGDWVIATSPNAAQRIAPALARCDASVAAVGASTAAELPRVDLVPAVQRAEGLLAELPAPAGPDARMVIAQAEGADPALADELVGRGWRITRLATHRSRSVVLTDAQRHSAQAGDVVVFTAGSQARAWVEAFGTARPPLVATMGPQTARNAESCGLKVDLVAADHSLPGVVRAMQDFLKP